MISAVDYGVIAVYAAVLVAIALFVSRVKEGHERDTQDYFLAGRTLPWWAIGASLIAANISAEQIMGMSGEGFVAGLAIAAYEWQAALVLIIVAKFFLPIFLKKEIYTMPQFLDLRYGTLVKTTMSFYWVILFVVINLTTLLWLGAGAVEVLTGTDRIWGMIGLAGFAVLYSTYGGLKAVALTDIIQVVILIVGGIAITWFTIGLLGGDNGFMGGLQTLYSTVPEKFKIILNEDHPSYDDLPGIWTLLGGLWVLHFSYWGFNQYIIQRALGAKSLSEAQTGLAFAAFLKFLMPLIIVVPGIAAVLLVTNEYGVVVDPTVIDPARGGHSDNTYPALMQLMPTGFKGLIFAALVAAILSSLASMMNSISTIFTMDIYKTAVKGKSESHYVMVGRITAIVAITIAVILARPLLADLSSAFQTIQEYTGFIAPGVVSVFLLGMFWRRTNAVGAMAMLLGSIGLNILMKFYLGGTPFIIRIWIVTATCMALGVIFSMISPKPSGERPIDLNDMQFGTSLLFNILAFLVLVVLVGIYATFW